MSLAFQLEYGVIWTAVTSLASFDGYEGADAVRVSLGSSARDPGTVDATYQALVDRVMAAEPEVSRAVLAAIWAAYPKLREEFEALYGERPGDLMPPLSSPDDLATILSINALHIHGIEGDGEPTRAMNLPVPGKKSMGLAC